MQKNEEWQAEKKKRAGIQKPSESIYINEQMKKGRCKQQSRDRYTREKRNRERERENALSAV